MGIKFVPPVHSIIQYFPNVSPDIDDVSRSGFQTRDIWYHHYFTAFSFKVNIWAQYYFFGSEHLNIKLFKYSISQKKWILVNEYADLYGGWDAIANGEWGRISVNCGSNGTGDAFNWNFEDTDAIHWDVAIKRFKGVSGDHKSRIHLVTGNYTTPSESLYNSICKGSYKIKIPEVNYKWYVQGSANPVQDLPKNPFDTKWGNVTYAKGSKIMLSDFQKLIPLKLIK